MILNQDKVRRSPGFMSVGSRRYREWQNLALESTEDIRSEPPESMEYPSEPVALRPSFSTARSILRRPGSDKIDRDRTWVSTLESRPRAGMADATQIEAEITEPGRGHPSTPTTSPDADRYLSGDAESGGISASTPDQVTDRTDTKDIKTDNRTGTKDINPKTEHQNKIQLDQSQIKLDPGEEPDAKLPILPIEGVEQRNPPAEGATATTPPDAEDEEEIYYHGSGDLSAEDLQGNLAFLPKIPISTTAKVSIDDLQTPDRPHLRRSRGSDKYSPASKGVVSDIDVGNAKPIALQTRKVSTRFREKVAGLIKDLLAAEIIRPSTSPWASPIVIVRKGNGVNIRLCIGYKLVNSLTRLMVYSMPLISDLLEDFDKALWYCSLDMASGCWIVPMTDRAREISAFITPFGLFEWRRMSFGLKNAPQIYQRLVDNTLYGSLKISRSGDAGTTTDVFQTGIADDPDR
ncbi:LOW QUALITY PROTEIN: reverse transcriptase [Phytophthora megakarya]|uniref:Reverse transcriptase n=1 Tax=Phytophthora megakarya TaxID=4795 RepID=A0A225VHD5_9STRA|nr:LOW QUALITY PROTEIN: reverse transcriptase [Phytophthora megakarya]